MKKTLLVGMLITCSFQMAFAAGLARNAEGVRKTVSEETARARAAGEFKSDAASVTRTSNTLSRIAGANHDIELQKAMSRTIQVKEADGTSRALSLADIGNSIATADQALRTQNFSSLDALGKAHLEAVQEALKVSAEFLSLASRTSDMGAVLTEQQRLEVAAFNKQLSLIPEMITKMDTADLKAHTDAMKKAIAKKINPNMNGDQVFAAGLKDGKSQQDYMQKLNELVSCIR